MKELIVERFINLLKKEDKYKYVDDVWDMIQNSYASIGGIKGSGFESKEDMIEKIPFWKVAKKDGKVVAVALYKDKFGRKQVAMGTDGSKQGREKLAIIARDDVMRRRSYSEISSNALRFVMIQLGKDVDLTKYMIHPEEAEKILGEKLIYPIDLNDPEAIKYPELTDYFYQREIGGNLITKLMIGTPWNKIL